MLSVLKKDSVKENSKPELTKKIAMEIYELLKDYSVSVIFRDVNKTTNPKSKYYFTDIVAVNSEIKRLEESVNLLFYSDSINRKTDIANNLKSEILDVSKFANDLIGDKSLKELKESYQTITEG